MRNFQKKSIFLTLFGLLLSIYNLHSQTNNQTAISNWFDKDVGKENLDINNGTLHINPYKTVGDNNMYYISDKFELGSLTYNDQTYYDTNLKYDIYKDVLVLNPFGESEHLGIALTQNKVSAFSIKNNTFVRVETKNDSLPEFTSGYYEETKLSSDFILYIKHHKTIKKIISDNEIAYTFKDNNLFFITLNHKLYLIKGKNDIIKLFPEQKKEINGFYLMNREIKKSDLNQFMKNLMKYIKNSLTVNK
ncbi:hypothetical protein GKZ90_0008185 [Flavobacterium sp. MC2016-06]|uniref:hypothetical protein n=1 Tax=Flavobacterium sp. MC2016-06 TaxID=2676308 RepID=UPI0012BAD150|nr:hypothetical protein [Flavobacterium sp. MC2016-06]MBU3857991.1 hypothetical protein [Flavobacterium sp. MC2016-06]